MYKDWLHPPNLRSLAHLFLENKPSITDRATATLLHTQKVAVLGTQQSVGELEHIVEIALLEEPLIPSLALQGRSLQKEDGRTALGQHIQRMLDKLCGVLVRRIGEDAAVAVTDIGISHLL